MLNELKQWIESLLPIGRYRFSHGQWEDGAIKNNEYICALLMSGGNSPDADVRYQRFHVVMLGPTNTRSAAQTLSADAEVLTKASINKDLLPCGATSITALTEPVGPGYTTENRAFYELDFQIIF